MNPPATTIYENVPVFPLRDFYLHPQMLAPLHIFEPRYRQMVEDLLDGPGRLAMATIVPGLPPGPHGPEIRSIGGLGSIVEFKRLPDGRYLIVLLGLGRVALSERASDRPYRLADVRLLEPPEADPAAIAELKPRLEEALQQRAEDRLRVHPDVTLDHLADVLLGALRLDDERRWRAFSELDPVSRACLALRWHEELPLGDPVEDGGGAGGAETGTDSDADAGPDADADRDA